MERVREIANHNERDYPLMDIKTLLPGLEPWIRSSTLVHSFHTICAHDKTQPRFWLPAQCFMEGQEQFEKYLKEGLLIVPRIPAPEGDTWSKGALIVEICVICNKNVTINDFSTAQVVRLSVRVYPQCAQCQKVFENPDEEEKRMVCSECKIVFYCNAICQKEHWPEHKDKCYLLRKH